MVALSWLSVIERVEDHLVVLESWVHLILHPMSEVRADSSALRFHTWWLSSGLLTLGKSSSVGSIVRACL